MSKFCGVISHKPNTNSQHDLITFCNLENISNWLLRETEQLQFDFHQKHEALKNDQDLVASNERKIIDLHFKIAKLTEQISEIENELKAHDVETKKLDINVQTLECRCLSDNFPYRNSEACYRSEYQKLWELLEKFESSMVRVSLISNELAEYEKFMEGRMNPYQVILAILQQHVDTLQCIDKNLDLMKDKTLFIYDKLIQFMGKLGQTKPPMNLPILSPTNPILMPNINPLSMQPTNPYLLATTNPLLMPPTNAHLMPTTNPLLMPTTNPLNMPPTNPLNMPTTNPLLMPPTCPLNYPPTNPLMPPTCPLNYPPTNPLMPPYLPF